MTLAPASLVDPSNREFASLKLGDGTLVRTRIPLAGLPRDGAFRVGLRPEAVRVGGRSCKARIELVERLGERTLIYGRLSDGQSIIAEDSSDSGARIGDEIPLKIDGAEAHVFDEAGRAYHRALQ
jgi:multiple sugar transport system ATP-binding protein